MATRYVRTVNLKDSLSDEEVVEYWRFFLNELIPAAEKVEGVQSARAFSGAGGLRAQITFELDMDDAAAYERILVDPTVGKLNARAYTALDMKSATQSFLREITPELVGALSGTG